MADDNARGAIEDIFEESNELGIRLEADLTEIPSSFDRSHVLKHYTKRTKLTIQQLKVTLLVDTKSNTILDLHVTTRKHDSQIAPSLIKRNAGEVEIQMNIQLRLLI